MTTKVEVTVAGHKVAVTQTQITQGEKGHNVTDNVVTLEVTGQSATFYAHSNQRLTIEELDEKSHSAMADVNTGGKIFDVSQDQIDEITGAGSQTED